MIVPTGWLTDGSPPLTWPEVERLRGPEPMVAFDRDVGSRGWAGTLHLMPREQLIPRTASVEGNTFGSPEAGNVPLGPRPSILDLRAIGESGDYVWNGERWECHEAEYLEERAADLEAISEARRYFEAATPDERNERGFWNRVLGAAGFPLEELRPDAVPGEDGRCRRCDGDGDYVDRPPGGDFLERWVYYCECEAGQRTMERRRERLRQANESKAPRVADGGRAP